MMKDSKNTVLFSDLVNENDKQKREVLIKKIVSQMTLNEKLSFMSGSAKLSTLISYGSAPFPAGGCERLGIPSIDFTDGPRGVMLNKSTCFPVSMARGATWDPELEKQVGSAIGTEARAQGANLAGSVCINLLRHPSWGRAQETYGEDPYHLGEMGAAQTRGLQKHIMACIKHFAVNSIENARFWVDVLVDDRTLMEVYLPHFKKCVDAGAASVMGAYNKMNGKHCCNNKHLLTDILKETWNFDGFAISDWVFGVRGSSAAEAGLDIEMPNAVFLGLPLKIQLASGKVKEDVVDKAVIRIVRQLARFQNVGNDMDYTGKVACKKHTELALEVARKSIVLLKNDNRILPLDATKIQTIAVLGELANTENIGDKGSSNLHPPYVITLLEGIRNKAGNLINVKYSDGQNSDEVKKMAKNSDCVIIVAGLMSDDEGEFVPLLKKGGDRHDLGISQKQENMIKTAVSENKNCVVILEGGSAITMESWVDDVQALFMAWYPGMEGGNAVAEILFGEINPSGKLPVTFPKSEKQLPYFNKWARKIKYEYFHGYRHFDREGLEPLYHFGFGLSYTTFEFTSLRIQSKTVKDNGAVSATCKVTNTGNVRGEEVAQMYIGYPESEVERPIKELKGFSRVALEPGETKTVSFKILPEDVAYYDSATKAWKVEDIEYEIFVGSSSREEDLHLKNTFRIRAKTATT